MFDTPLCELAYKYGSDKCPQIMHHYTPFYYDLLKDRSIKKLLEIGIGYPEDMKWTGNPDYVIGASLRMWRDFLPEARIFGIDIQSSALFSDERIETFLADQTDISKIIEILSYIGNDLDVVIDDGSHNPDDQVYTCSELLPLLKKEVIYVIEDVAHPEIAERLSEFDCSFPKLKSKARRDDRLLMVKHKI